MICTNVLFHQLSGYDVDMDTLPQSISVKCSLLDVYNDRTLQPCQLGIWAVLSTHRIFRSGGLGQRLIGIMDKIYTEISVDRTGGLLQQRRHTIDAVFTNRGPCR
jgi:hypothetical protein